MSVSDYKVLSDTSSENLGLLVAAQLPAWQPYGVPFSVDGRACQALVKGAVDTNNLASSAAGVLDGDTISVVNSAGADSHSATAEVSSNALSDVKFAATVAMVDNADTVTVHDSTGAAVTGTHTAEVALGVLTDVKLDASIAPVADAFALTGVTPSGSYTNTVTFTVAGGAITAIVLS